MRDSVSLRIRRLPGRNSQGHCHSRLRGKWIRALSPTEWRFDKACPRYGSDALRAARVASFCASAKQPTAAHTAPTVATALASALSTTFSRSRLAATTIATTIASALSPLSASGPAAEPESESEPQPEPVSQPNQPSSEPALATFDPTADAAALSRSHLAAAGIAP